MTGNNQPKDLFDRHRRRLIHHRAWSRATGEDFLSGVMAEDLIDRLSLVKRQFHRCLLIGAAPRILRDALEELGITVTTINSYVEADGSTRRVYCDEDRLPFADHSFDLVICIGALDTVNDLPGALILIRKILMPDGFFLAAFPGAESLSVLKTILMDAEGDRVAAHIHPQIDVRTLGDLMTRTGFALPVVDSHSLQLRYRALADLLSDIRDYGGSNVLAAGSVNITKAIYNRVQSKFTQRADANGKTTEKVELLFLCGWAPHPDQPKPARRGSGTVSLSTALGEE